MKPTVSARLVWSLAAREAVAGEFQEIEPPHLFNAILTFSEMDSHHFERAVDEEKVIDLILSDRDSVREKLNACSIGVPDDSTAIRRRIRVELGNGGHPAKRGDTMHRSGASRGACREAENLAAKAEEPEWGCDHLLEALLSSPTPEMESVLAELTGLPNVGRGKETPILNEIGRDLTALAVANELDDTPENELEIMKDPVCKVLIDELTDKNTMNILLIQAGNRPGREVVHAIAKLITSTSVPKNARGKRIVELDSSMVRLACGETNSTEVSRRAFEDKLHELLQEAKDDPYLILYLQDFHEFVRAGSSTNTSRFLKEILAREGIRCIACIDAEHYRHILAPDQEWKKIFKTISIHSINVPFEL